MRGDCDLSNRARGAWVARMSGPAHSLSPPPRAPWLPVGLLWLAIALAYAPTLRAPFIFDDHQVIEGNASIRQLATALRPPADGSGVTGRPLLNFTFALNYAIGGEDVLVYHATNILIHALAALALFGVMRRTLLLTRWPATVREHAQPLAGCISFAWALHPLQTESVTCVAQRTESLVGLLFLATFYFFLRSTEPNARGHWLWLALVTTFAGVATKEVMVAAPVLVLLFDRTFLAGTFRAAWQQRRWVYLGLFSSWLLLGALVVGQAGTRGGTDGAALGPTMFAYALTQCGAVVHYLRLAAWPYPLVLDYDPTLVRDVAKVAAPALLLAVLLVLLVLTAMALRRRAAWGFAGAWFFCILAPSSSVVPLLAQPVAEHRMYLPLAGVIAAALVGAFMLGGRRLLVVAWIGSLAGAFVTVQRNRDYETAERIWADTVAKQPGNARAHYQLARAWEAANNPLGALASYRTALALHENYAEAHADLGRWFGLRGDSAEALRHLETAVRLKPKLVTAQKNLGLFLSLAGQQARAIAILQGVLAERPADVDALTWLGDARLRGGDAASALLHYAAATKIDPAAEKAHTNAGAACLLLGRNAEAQVHLSRAVALNPRSLEARRNLGLALMALGRVAEAREQFEAVLTLRPDDAVAREQLAALPRAR